MDDKKNYSKNNIVLLFFSLFPTYFFSYIAQSLGNIINGLFVGNYLSSLDMAAIGFYNPYNTVILVLPTIINSGARIVCGKFIGRGQKEKVNETFSIAILSILIFGSIVTLVSIFLSSTIASILGASDATLKLTSDYIKTIGLGFLPNMLTSSLLVFLQMENRSKYSLYSVLLLALCTFGFNFVGVRFLNFSIFLAGLLNSLSQLVVFVFILIAYIKEKDLPRYSKDKNIIILKNIILLGLPSALFGILIGIRNIEINKATLLYGGDAAVSAISILNSSEAPFDAVASAVSTIVTMLASVYYGEKDRNSLKQLCKVSIIFGELMTIIRLLIIFLFTPQIASLFGATEEVAKYTTTVYLIYGLAMPLNIIVITFMSTYQSLGKSLYCNILYFVSILLVNVACARFLSLSFGVNGVWAGFILQELANIIGIYIIATIQKKDLIVSFDDLLFHDDTLDVGNHITISITNQEGVMIVSKSIEDYCLSQGVDKKRAMYSGLVLEEVATNIIEHGFSKTKKKNKSIDIYCDVDDDTKDINMRVKDNAASFDPYVKINNSDDPTTNIGLRLVSKLAKEMNYQNDFGLNVLNITL